jgi:hypothetical protein
MITVLTYKQAAKMQVHAAPKETRRKKFQGRDVFMNESFCKQQKEPKILGYNYTLFRM